MSNDVDRLENKQKEGKVIYTCAKCGRPVNAPNTVCDTCFRKEQVKSEFFNSIKKGINNDQAQN